MVTIVLLKEAQIWATPSVITRLTLFLVLTTDCLAISLGSLYFLIALRGPFRVRALVLVRCPRKGRQRL